MREYSGIVMGTSLEIVALGIDPKRVDQAIDAAVVELQRVEDRMTDWRPSELTRLNDSAGAPAPQPVSPELALLIAHSLQMTERTDGAFDITYAAVGALWDFKTFTPALPPAASIQAALAFVGAHRVRVDLERSTVPLPKGVRLGLGGIAKGYGVDRAMAKLMAAGVEHALITAGGDMKILGLKFGKPWEIAIKHPRDRERAMASLKLSNTCLSTSGDYERFFEIDGKRYHHIIDPRTGYPSEGCITASVVAPESEYADALATALCVMGPEKGLALVEKLPRVEAIVVGMDGEVRASSGLQSFLAP